MHIFYDIDGNEIVISNAAGIQKNVGKATFSEKKSSQKSSQQREKEIRDKIENERKKLRKAYEDGKPRAEFARNITELTALLETL